MRFIDIDWNALYRREQQRKTGPKKDRTTWNRRAESFARRSAESSYPAEFLRRMPPPDPTWTILDIGAGTGALAIPLAKQVRSVTALDFSSAMRDILQRNGRRAGLTNLKTVEASWEDDWQALAIPRHDVVIASRALAVEDLEAALTKADRWARQAVFVTDRVGGGPFIPEAFAAVGRPFHPGPDYIYTVNILYRLGIHARVDFIRLPEPVYPSRDQALAAQTWMFDRLSPQEEKLLAACIDSRLHRVKKQGWQVQRKVPVTWAFISWQKDPAR